MSTKGQKHDSLDERARAFIDRIVEINREHGMGDRVSNETYQRAVEQSKAIASLVPQD